MPDESDDLLMMGLRALVGKGSTIDVIYLDLCEALDAVPCDIFASKLWRSEFDGWTI